MAEVVLQEILSQLKGLEINELQELDRAIQKYIADKQQVQQTAFHDALLASGLVKQIKRPIYRQITQEQLIQVEGQSISETIVEERR